MNITVPACNYMLLILMLIVNCFIITLRQNFQFANIVLCYFDMDKEEFISFLRKKTNWFTFDHRRICL